MVSCKQSQRFKSKSGLVYTLYSDGKDSVARLGMIAKIHYMQKAGDSLIDNTYETLPLYYQVMPAVENQYNPLEVFDYGMRKGDSVITVQIVDSMVKKGILDSIPYWMSPGEEWITHLKVVDVYAEETAQQADRILEINKAIGRQKTKGMQRIKSYLDQHNITSIEQKDSLYVQVLTLGKGTELQDRDPMHLKYRLATLKGFVLVDTRDTGNMEPQEVIVGSGFLPKVLEDQIKLYPAGSHIKVFVPQAVLFGIEAPARETRLDDDWMVELQYN